MWMRIVVFKIEVLVFESENILHFGVDDHSWQRPWLAGELEACLIEMVEIEMRVAEGMDEFARLKAGGLRHHHEQKSIAGYVERHSEETVGASLIQL